MLTVVKKTNTRSVKDKSPILLCKCDCGETIKVKQKTLDNLDHCGCKLKPGYKFMEPKEEPYPTYSKEKLVTIDNETHTVNEWIAILQPPVSKQTIMNRLNSGMDTKKAFTYSSKYSNDSDLFEVGQTVKAFEILEINQNNILAKCKCGNIIKTTPSRLCNPATTSCGCSSYSITATPTYASWQSMKQRCLNKNNSHYSNYGGRGITVCDRWLIYSNFLQDMGERSSNQSIERLDVNGNYEPSNCIWLDKNLQSLNTTRSIIITINGEQRNLAYWLSKYNVHYASYRRRIEKGMTPEEALNYLQPELQKHSIPIEYNGELLSAKQAWIQYGAAVAYSTLLKRLNQGMPFEQAILKRQDW